MLDEKNKSKMMPLKLVRPSEPLLILQSSKDDDRDASGRRDVGGGFESMIGKPRFNSKKINFEMLIKE